MTTKQYDFDEMIDRQNSNAMAVDGFRDYLFTGQNHLKFPVPDHEIIPMWVADMGFATPPEIIEAIQDRLNKRIFGYTKIFDLQYFDAFSNWTGARYDWSPEKEHLVTSPGIIPALFELIKYICSSDEKVIIFTPSYAFFKHSADYNNIELVTSGLIEKDGHYSIDFTDFKDKCADPKVTLCIFCHPHNPTGRVWTTRELQEFGDICLNNHVMVISDEIHCDIQRKGIPHTPLAKLFPDSDQIITCMAPSKTFNLAGLLFANIIIPNSLIRKKWHARHHIFENPLSVAAAQAAYEHGQDWLGQLTDYLDKNFKFTQNFLRDYLPEATFNIPHATYFGWINVGTYLPNEENLTLYFAQEAGVLLEGGNMFVANADNWIRLNLACPRVQLQKALLKIAASCTTTTSMTP
ncbi:MAG: cystathionine beta-lyase [Desulforhopalus sp.]|jgi:cystathionine beta-lyase